jgi:hypothetical protein
MARGPSRDVMEATMARALDILATRDPRRLDRIRHRLNGIIVAFGGASGPAGLYNEQLRVCEINSAFYSDGQPGNALLLALTIVHEAMHGLLASIGYSAREPCDEATRVRIERACVRAELAVLDRLAPVAGSRAPLEQALLRQLESTAAIYSHEEQRRRLRSMLREMWALVRGKVPTDGRS